MLKRKKHVELAICIGNRGYEDLETWKIYQVLPDEKAARVGCIRVIDESGEDYLYPGNRFLAVDFPKNVRARLPPSNGPNKTLLPPKQAKHKRLKV